MRPRNEASSRAFSTTSAQRTVDFMWLRAPSRRLFRTVGMVASNGNDLPAGGARMITTIASRATQSTRPGASGSHAGPVLGSVRIDFRAARARPLVQVRALRVHEHDADADAGQQDQQQPSERRRAAVERD